MSGSAQIFPLGAQPSTKNGAGGTITIQLLPLGDCLLGLFFFLNPLMEQKYVLTSQHHQNIHGFFSPIRKQKFFSS